MVEKGRSGHGRRHCSGQVMMEYVIITCMVLASVAILAVFLYAFRENGSRVLDLVGFDYP
jgi:hypothetical protein